MINSADKYGIEEGSFFGEKKAGLIWNKSLFKKYFGKLEWWRICGGIINFDICRDRMRSFFFFFQIESYNFWYIVETYSNMILFLTGIY